MIDMGLSIGDILFAILFFNISYHITSLSMLMSMTMSIIVDIDRQVAEPDFYRIADILLSLYLYTRLPV